MENKTALELAIEKLNTLLSAATTQQENAAYWNGYIAATYSALQTLDMFLPTEKQQIVDAYKADLYPCSDEDAETYYNETFNKEKA